MADRRDEFDEFLTGYLDGNLTDDERAIVEKSLAEDANARQALGQLRRMRECLVSQPPRQLDSGFAERVLTASRQRAVEMGSNAPKWIHPSLEDSPSASPKRRTVAYVGGIAAILALAASVCFVLLSNRPQEPSGLTQQSPPSSIPENSLAQQSSPSSTSGSFASPGRTEESAQGPDNPPVRPPVRPGADVARSTQASEAPSMAPAATNSQPDNERPDPAGLASTPPRPPESTAADQMLKDLEKQLATGQPLRYLLVVDLTLSPAAWDDHHLRTVFARNDIAFEDPVVVDSQLQESLKTSRLVGAARPAQEASAPLALVFVKARGNRLDRAITQILTDVVNYPEFSLDMAIDPPAQDVMDRLQHIREFGEELALANGTTRRQGIARSLAAAQPAANNDLIVGHFVSTQRRTPAMPKPIRQQANPPRSFDFQLNPVEYCLFVLRPPVAETPKP